MTTVPACPSCGSALREIVWGYGTIADVEDAGDVVIGGCVVDVDGAGRVAALQCPICDTRTDAAGVALAAPEPPATTGHPFDVSFSSPPRGRWEAGMPDSEPSQDGSDASDGAAARPPDGHEGAAGKGGWRDHVEPYASRDDVLPPGPVPTRDRVEPYASRDDLLPSGGAVMPDHVEPYASRSGDLPAVSGPSRDHVDPYVSHDDVVPRATGAWRERIDPYAGGPGDEPAAPPGGRDDG